MGTLFVFGDRAKLNPYLKRAIEDESHKDSRLRFKRIAYLLSDQEGIVGLENAKARIMEAILAQPDLVDGSNAVLASGNSVLWGAACLVLENYSRKTPTRIVPHGRSFLVITGPLGKGETIGS